MLRNGITAQVFQELTRKVFVDVAHEEFGIEGKPQTMARVSVITGLNRKEVARLHKLPPIDESDRTWLNRAGNVLTAWMTDSNYHSGAGYPLDLSFSGATPNFSELVKSYSGDMYPRAVADELIRIGAVEQIDGKLRMSKRGYVPSSDPAMIIDDLGYDAAEFIETVDHNIGANPDQQLLQLKVVASNLPAEHLDAFNKYSKRLTLNTIEEVTRWLNEHDLGKDMSGDDPRYAVGIAAFQINRIVRAGQKYDPMEDK